MKEKLSSVVEKLKMIGRLVLMSFAVAGIAFAFIGEKTGRFFKKNKKTFIPVAMVVVLLAGWILGAGLMILDPQTVQVVRYPEHLKSIKSLILFEKPTALVNDTDGTKVWLTWPRIPWLPGIGSTLIGSREESYSLKESIQVSEKIKLFPLSQLSGDPADENKIVYLTVSGTFEVIDWETFLIELDPTMVKEEFQTKARSELLAYNVAMYLFQNNIDNWFAESISRTYLAEKFAKENNLKTEEEIEYFIKVYRSWYWPLGAMYFHSFEEEVLRNPFPDSSMYELGVMCVRAAGVENAIDYNTEVVKLLENQKQAFCEEFDPTVVQKAESIIADFKNYFKDNGGTWPPYEAKKELSEFLIKTQMKGAKYTSLELYAARALVEFDSRIDMYQGDLEFLNQQASSYQEFFKSLRLWQSKGNDSLWKFAIQRVAKGESLPETIDFYPWFKTDGMEYLAEVAEFYQELGAFESSGVKFQKLTFGIEEVIEKPAPAK